MNSTEKTALADTLIDRLRAEGFDCEDQGDVLEDYRRIVRVTGTTKAKISLHFGSCTINVDTIFIDGGSREKGICRSLIKLLYRFGERHHFEGLRILASGPHAFVWPMLGFQPTRESWSEIKAETLELFDRNIGMLEHDGVTLLNALRAASEPALFIALGELISAGRDLPPAEMARKILQRTWGGELCYGNQFGRERLFR